jgi:hypothetical protein
VNTTATKLKDEKSANRTSAARPGPRVRICSQSFSHIVLLASNIPHLVGILVDAMGQSAPASTTLIVFALASKHPGGFR